VVVLAVYSCVGLQVLLQRSAVVGEELAAGRNALLHATHGSVEMHHSTNKQTKDPKATYSFFVSSMSLLLFYSFLSFFTGASMCTLSLASFCPILFPF